MSLLRVALGEAWRLVAGVTRRPVDTYENIARSQSWRGGVTFIGLLTPTAAGLCAAGAIRSPQFLPSAGGLAVWSLLAVFGVYLAASATIWLVGRLLGGRGSLGAVLTAWAGSYVPTTVWFAGLALFHVLFVPSGFIDPTSAEGLGGSVTVQVVFLAFSLAAFLWKTLLLYLTLRVVGRLDFGRIAVAVVLLAPVAFGYWRLGLHFGWFKVPWI